MLHPQARAALAEAAEREDYLVPGRPGFDLARTRAELRSTRPGPCEEVAHVAEVDADGVACRLFRPEPGAPVVAYLHGGGWALGSIEEAEPLCRRLANRSVWAVLAVDYRLAPEHTYPAAIEDVERAVAWLQREGAALGVDASRPALAGDSAGANLCAALTLRARDRGAPAYALQALLYPVLDLVDEAPSRAEFAERFGLDRTLVRWHIESYAPSLADRRRPDVSPLLAASLRGLPPAVVVTAEYDPLRDEGEEYAARLADAGVPVVATRYLGMIHGFADLTRFDAARDLIDGVAAALRNAAPRASAPAVAP